MKKATLMAVRSTGLVGALGEFTDGRGRVKQCRVTATEYDGKGLIITYYNDEAGQIIEGAHIAAHAFRPDERPNKEICNP